VVFVKQGANPYVVVADDIKKDTAEHDYHWQWWTEAKAVAGAGTFAKPFLIDGQKAQCAIAFVEPEAPAHVFEAIKAPDSRRGLELGRLRVNRRAIEARYVALAAAWRKEAKPPVMRRGPKVSGNPAAASIAVEGEGFRDLIVWQPEDASGRGALLTAGRLKTDALMTVVRTDARGRVTAYLMGDGSTLEFGGRTLARSPQPLSISADAKGAMATGARRAREGEAPLEASGSFRVPGAKAAVWVDGERVQKPAIKGEMVTINGKK
jgi:hypothetical protein